MWKWRKIWQKGLSNWKIKTEPTIYKKHGFLCIWVMIFMWSQGVISLLVSDQNFCEAEEHNTSNLREEWIKNFMTFFSF